MMMFLGMKHHLYRSLVCFYFLPAFLVLDEFVAVALAGLSVLQWRFSKDSVFVMRGCAVKSEQCTVKPKLYQVMKI